MLKRLETKKLTDRSTSTSFDDSDQSTDDSSDMPKKKTDMTKNGKMNDSQFKEAVVMAGNKFIHEILPKVPTMANGMKILGAAETSPLTKTGEVYKLRIAHPNRPIGMSEVWDDRTTLRMTTFAKLISDELHLLNFKIEVACMVPGALEKDVTGNNAIKGLYEVSDTNKLTIKPFIQRKISGLFRS